MAIGSKLIIDTIIEQCYKRRGRVMPHRPQTERRQVTCDNSHLPVIRQFIHDFRQSCESETEGRGR